MVSHLKLVAPSTENRKVTPRRQKDTRTRKHLTPSEVDSLVKVAKGFRHGDRDSLMILMTYHHGLRACEVTELKWNAVDFTRATLHVNRAKNGISSSHPIPGAELRALRALKRGQNEKPSPFVFVSERGAPMTTSSFAKLVERCGKAAELHFKAHPHQLRHACGFALANDGVDTRSLQAYMGHANIQNTVGYAALASGRFKDFWKR
jgi:type 1 fimbriae regulatory protein FimB/type 1 fimbriae regulatory protein FimE